MKRLTGIHNIFQQALGASQKVFEYLDHTRRSRRSRTRRSWRGFEKGIVFDDVSFHYPGAPDGFVIRCARPGSEGRRGGGAGGAERRRARPRWPTWCRASTTSPAGAVRIDGRDVRDLQPGVAARADRHRGAGHVPVQRHGGEQHRLRPARHAVARPDPRGGARPRWRTSSSCGCRRATTP